VRDYDLHSRLSDLRFLHAAVLALLDAAGLSTLAEHLEQWSTAEAVQRFNLDGLLALWHPADAN
jgi:protease-4